MFEPGTFVAEHVTPTTDEQVQPNGVDLTLGTVFEQTTPGRIGRDGKALGERRERRPGDGAFALPPGAYVVEYGETIGVPEDHVGFLLPRSSLLRNSCTLNTAVWDAGYEGRGEGLLQVGHRIEIEPGARIAQLVFAEADHAGTYGGDYQGEGSFHNR
ncbi:MAG: deoxyuridine 5'-triphosphate nucleotidohydrolase [Halobacteriales archaeon]